MSSEHELTIHPSTHHYTF